MCAKPKPPIGFAVRAPEALRSLEAWLGTLEANTRSRGQIYFEQGRVVAAWTGADHFVEAEVKGEELYNVTLFFTRGKWSARCSCPVGTGCKHAAATGLAWVAHQGADFETEVIASPPLVESPVLKSKPAAPASKAETKISFRDRWTPILAEKLGRRLTDEEGLQLAQLTALFTQFRNSGSALFDESLRHHGFADAIPADAEPWTPLFRSWWTPTTAPADPWALWQYLAYSLERRGRPIPEVFRPLTDTAPVHAALDAHLAQQHIHAWRSALATPAELGHPVPGGALRDSIAGLRARLGPDGGAFLEVRTGPDKPWKPPVQRWVTALARARPADFDTLTPAEAALALTVAMMNRQGYRPSAKFGLAADILEAVLASRTAHGAIVLPDGRPFTIEPEPLVPEAVMSATVRDQFEVHLVAPDGSSATGARLLVSKPTPLYLHGGRVWRGPPQLPSAPLPASALGDAHLMSLLRTRGVRLPSAVEAKVRRVVLRPVLKCWIADSERVYDFSASRFHAQLFARAADPVCEQQWSGGGGWQWTKGGAPPPRRTSDPILEFDLTAANAVGACFADFRLGWFDWSGSWTRIVPKTFPEEFLAWHATLPPGLDIEASPELAGFFAAPLRATMDFSAAPADSGRDWFDLTVALRVEDTTLSAEEIALLLKARGKWVRLPSGGWRRLELASSAPSEAAAATLDRLGLTADDVFASGRSATHRLHALQLASEAASLESRDAQLAATLRDRVTALAALPRPQLPASLTATLRPYQLEGFHFLAHLAANGFGGVLADDMGLGKTVQALAWLLHEAKGSKDRGEKYRALVVCPKSVMHGWLAEAARFAPTLSIAAFTPEFANTQPTAPGPQLLVANYTQFRLNASWFQQHTWDAAILDEGQFIKNPSSQAAVTARALIARHRLVLTGTPIENRLTDLWSLFAFAQPGLLGGQAAFRRQYNEKEPAALARLHRRVHHFLLRRTKAEAAPDLPPRTEDEIVVELEPEQRQLYDAELKRARAQLLGIETTRALDKVRFNILASLLRLRQICCHPALIDPAHAELPSAKLDALLERLEELQEEGHQVLVFSQFVEMLELIRTRLVGAGIGHLMLTGKTENRAELVNTFQTDTTKTVFLLSLKAAGFGLNLTAASYAILYDPWWNPAVEAQAIDRTHRIGQTRPVFAYRLLAENTVEQKIRALQQEKSALAAAVVQEESLAKVLDLDSLRKILA